MQQQNYVQMQMYQQQLEQLSQQMEMLNQQLAEVEISQSALEELQKTEIDNEILATVAPGVFVKAKLAENQKVIVNVGANSTVEKNIPVSSNISWQFPPQLLLEKGKNAYIIIKYIYIYSSVCLSSCASIKIHFSTKLKRCTLTHL